ncbi:hypothetical protein [Verrucomicrobium spinosum]|uniref:hypothetical protein n=1 Tax=Verrucomicrobium spinosum TaxID=2736 RepID=UPI000A4402DE|nr:hypothetical protein [Verrucomicrobium spinosum]
MLSELDTIQLEGLTLLASVGDETALEALRVNFLGKKGRLTAVASQMRDVPPDQKAAVGAKLNEVRTALTAGIEQKLLSLQAEKDAASVQGIDITLPGRPSPSATLHPLSRIRDRAIQTLRRMGFAVAEARRLKRSGTASTL